MADLQRRAPGGAKTHGNGDDDNEQGPEHHRRTERRAAGEQDPAATRHLDLYGRIGAWCAEIYRWRCE